MDILSTNLVPHHARRDPVRSVARARVRVKMRMKQYLVPGVGLVKAKNADADGWVTFEMYADEVDKVLADVETDHAVIQAAIESHEQDLAEWVRSKSGASPEQLAKPRNEWPDAAVRAFNTYAGSPEAKFFSLKRRGIKPLVAAEVLEADLPPLMTDEQKQSVQLAQALAAASMGGGAMEIIASLRAEIAALRDQINGGSDKAPRVSARRSE